MDLAATSHPGRAPGSAHGGRAMRVEMLAQVDGDTLHRHADALLARFPPPVVVRRPQVGVVMMQVREPVVGDRFHLGEVVVSHAEVSWCGATGWSMRLGTDRAAALSAALCDAGAELDDEVRDEIDALCRATRDELAVERAVEWTALAATTVRFEELD